jgi:hypothetical protein
MATGVSITDHAVEKIKQRLAAEKREGQGLRVKVVQASRTNWILIRHVPEIKFLRRTGLRSWWI